MIIYHGSENIISNPEYPKGNLHNDYGLAFYTTEDYQLAAEWAVDRNRDGYVNEYELSTDGLKILNLAEEPYQVLHWITILLQNRVFDLSSEIMKRGKEYLETNYGVLYREYDVIVGWRADDSYFSFARAFLNNTISVEKLSEAILLGNLGMQTALVSDNAFANLKFLNSYLVSYKEYYPLKNNRDDLARSHYKRMNQNNNVLRGTYLIDLIRRDS